jgi:hypothetical protein
MATGGEPGTAVGGQFSSETSTALEAVGTGAPDANYDPQVALIRNGLRTSAALSIENRDQGGKRWDLRTSGSADPLSGVPGEFYIYNQRDNRVPFYISPHALSSTVSIDVDGLKIGGGGAITARRLNIMDGVSQESMGFRHKRVPTGSIPAHDRVDVRVNWVTSTADAHYTTNCSILDESKAGPGLKIERIREQTKKNVLIQVINDSELPLSGILNCTAVHD